MTPSFGLRDPAMESSLDIPFLLAEDVPAMEERVRIARTVLGNLCQLVQGLIVALLILKGQAQIVPDLMVARFLSEDIPKGLDGLSVQPLFIVNKSNPQFE
jgi:hypothetical protein